MNAKTKKIIIISLCCLLLIAACGVGVMQYQRHQANIAAQEAARAAEEAAALAAAQRLQDLMVKAKQPIHAFERPAPPPLVPRQNMLELI
ncbi:MAG: hypothetical protein LBH09_07520, partial [Peptococcaceae bacterium]|nr:hypothetical protein [Peptococcaceae bacterium]